MTDQSRRLMPGRTRWQKPRLDEMPASDTAAGGGAPPSQIARITAAHGAVMARFGDR